MADVYLSMNYKVDLSDKEMRLICLGLASRLTRTEDVRDAAALNVRLVKAQQIRLREQINKIDGVAKKLAEEDTLNEAELLRQAGIEDV